MAAVSSGTATVTLPTDEQILITREFDAPKHLVYKAWTTPELVKRWWSGRRGTVTLAEIDLRVGGQWRYVMEANRGGVRSLTSSPRVSGRSTTSSSSSASASR